MNDFVVLISILGGAFVAMLINEELEKSQAQPSSSSPSSSQPSPSQPSTPQTPQPYTPPPTTSPVVQPTTIDAVTLADRVRRAWFTTVPVTPATEQTIFQVSQAIVQWSNRFELDPEWVAAIAMTESSYGRYTVNPQSTARGVMQITRDTWETINMIIRARYIQYREYCIQSHEQYANNIDSNVMHGCVYLRYIIDRVTGAFRITEREGHKVIATYCYYAGPAYVERLQATGESYDDIIANITQRLTQNTIVQPYNWSAVQYVRRVMSYYTTLRNTA